MRSRMSGVTARTFSGVGWNPARSKNGSMYALSCSTGRARICSALSQTALGSKGSSSVKLTTAFGAVDVFEREGFKNLVEGHELAVVFGRPAEQTKKIDEGLGKEAGVAIGGDANDGAMFPFLTVWRHPAQRVMADERTAAAARRGPRISAGA